MQSYNKMSPVKIGETAAQQLTIGQDASKLPKSERLPAKYYYVGELVGIVRHDGRRTVGQIISMPDPAIIMSIDDQIVKVLCARNAVKYIKAIEVPFMMNKLLGNFHLSGLNSVMNAAEVDTDLVIQPASTCATVFRSVLAGQDARFALKEGGVGLEYYYVGEVVSVEGKGGEGQFFSKITALNPEYIIVADEDGIAPTERLIPAAEVPMKLSKLLGAFCMISRVYDNKDWAPRIAVGSNRRNIMG